jgi:hypothetical protein
MKAGNPVAGQMPTAHDEGMQQPRPGDEQILQQLGAAGLNEIVKLLRHRTQGFKQ